MSDYWKKVLAIILKIVVIVLALGGFVFFAFNYQIDKSLERIIENPTKHDRDVFELTGGLFSFVCLLPDIQAVKSDIQYIEGLNEYVGNTNIYYSTNWFGMQKAIYDFEKAKDPDATVWSAGKKLYAAHNSYKRVIAVARNAYSIAMRLPVFDENTKLAKKRLMKALRLATLIKMHEVVFDGSIDYDKQYCEDDVCDTYYNSSPIEDIVTNMESAEEFFVAWFVSELPLIMRSENKLVQLFGLYLLSPDNKLVNFLDDPKIEELLKASPNFRYARERGCLHNGEMFEKVDQIMKSFDKAFPNL